MHGCWSTPVGGEEGDELFSPIKSLLKDPSPPESRIFVVSIHTTHYWFFHNLVRHVSDSFGRCTVNRRCESLAWLTLRLSFQKNMDGYLISLCLSGDLRERNS